MPTFWISPPSTRRIVPAIWCPRLPKGALGRPELWEWSQRMCHGKIRSAFGRKFITVGSEDDEHEDKICAWFEGWTPYSNQSRIWEDGRLNLFEHVCAGCRDKPNHSGNERTIGQTWLDILDDRGGRNDSRSPPRRQESRSPPRSHDYCSYCVQDGIEQHCGTSFLWGISKHFLKGVNMPHLSSKQFAHPYLRPLEFPKLCTYTSMCTVMCEYRSCTDQVLGIALGTRQWSTPQIYIHVSSNQSKQAQAQIHQSFLIMLVHFSDQKYRKWGKIYIEDL